LARRGYNTISSIISKSWELLIVNYAINAVRGVLPHFNIFKGERLKDDYIKLCKPGTCMAMQKKTWMTTFLFKKFMYFFNKSIPTESPSTIDTHYF